MLPLALGLWAQQDAGKLLSAYEARFALMDSLLFSSKPLPSGLLTGVSFTEPQRIDEIDNWTQARIDAAKSKTGLEISGQTYFRPGSGIGYDPDDPLAAYNFKAQAEIQWHIFQSSLYKRANKIKQLRLQGEMAQLEFEKEAIAQTIIDQKLDSRRKHDAELLVLLQYHSDNLAVLTETQTYLLQNGKISSDDLLKLMSDKADIDRQLTAIKSDSLIKENLLAAEANLMLIDTLELLSHLRMNHRDLAKLDMQAELLECRREGIDYLQTMSVSPFARYAWYNRPGASNSNNIDLGVSFKIPLSAEASKERKALKAEQEKVRRQQQALREQLEREVGLILLELHSYNQSIRGEVERLKKLKAYMADRNNSYMNRIGEYNRLSRLMEYNACLASWEKLVNYEYQRDCKLIDLQSYIMDKPITEFVKIISVK